MKTHCVNGPPRIAVVRSYDFEHAGTAKTFERLCGRIAFALLCRKQRVSNVAPDGARKRAQTLSDVPIHLTGFSSPSIRIPVYVYYYIHDKSLIAQASTIPRTRSVRGCRLLTW